MLYWYQLTSLNIWNVKHKKAIIDYEIEDKKIKEGSLDVLAQHLVGVVCSNPFKENILYNVIKAFPYKN